MPHSDPLFEKATLAIQDAIPQAEKDPFRPVFHFRPPARWMNDPNGTMFHNGYYHVFYQLHPFGDTHGPMYWGHTRSKDLAHWEHLPIGLCPSHDRGETDCYSGCAWKTEDGTPILIYTKVDKSTKPHPDFEQWAAVPQDEDLIHWEKYANNPIMEKQPEFGASWRDPFVFEENGRTFAVVGACEVGTPLYEATNADLTQWQYLDLMCDISTECPNFFKINEKYILLSSPYRPVEYHIGDFDANAPSFTIQNEGVLDQGEVNEKGRMKNGFYASNICFNERRQCILFGWVRGWEAGRGWNGCLALPRMLTVDPQNRPRQIPIPALRELRDQHTHIAATEITNTHVLSDIQSDTFEMLAVIEPGTATQYGLSIRCDQAGASGIDITYDGQNLTVANVSFPFAFDPGEPALFLHLFHDKSVLEVFANGGRAVSTQVVMPTLENQNIAVLSNGGTAHLKSADIWTLKSIW
ncbi:MAG: glycoside hydrolase family 32 protein [Candidatus Latescibacteria bacterium]|jgi:sucrose-6-phosphate hydrolase SacC (GH32 family)|nr:glycoside hydrolase family 32 protein [Candidatus Latescibacterota bacterium]MBT5830536.1 glycoside hydrolase family 32 protein [Candidatus Latescibacterota bacterium]